MKETNKQSHYWFYLLLFLALGLSYLVQSQLAHRQLFDTYLFNTTLTVLGFELMIRQQKKREEILGFVFMGVSGLKFLLFFLFYKPFRLSPQEKEALFWAFFIPYALCVVLEVYFLVKKLNGENAENLSS